MKYIFLFLIITHFACFFATPKPSTFYNDFCGSSNFEVEVMNEDVNITINTTKQYHLFNYFYNLNNNFGDNNHSGGAICVDVAFGMIMSYFDCYYNDDVIPENFDYSSECFNDGYELYSVSESPGIYSNIPSNCFTDYGFNVANIQNYLSNNEDYVLEYLATISRGGVSGYFSTVSAFSTVNNFLTDINNRFEEDYDYPIFDQDNTNTSIFCCDDIINYLNDGIPIFTNISIGGGFGHAVVIFAYDAINELFIYHSGYKNNVQNETFGIINPYSDTYLGTAIFPIVYETIDMHKCSNNYVDIYDDDITYCPCMLNDYFIENHNHTIDHYCTYSFDEDELTVSSIHSEYCSMLQDTKTIGCDVDEIDFYNSNTHLIEFSCGETKQENHYIIDIECVGTDVHEGFCICGSLGYEIHDFSIPIIYNNNEIYICICGLQVWDHYNLWRNFIRDYLLLHDYFEYDFYEELEEYMSLFLQGG